MNDRPRPKRPPKKPVAKRPEHSLAHITVWTMSGEPMPGSTMRRVEEAIQRVVNESNTRLLLNITKL